MADDPQVEQINTEIARLHQAYLTEYFAPDGDDDLVLAYCDRVHELIAQRADIWRQRYHDRLAGAGNAHNSIAPAAPAGSSAITLDAGQTPFAETVPRA